MSTPKPSDARVLSTEPLKSEDARWTKLVKITYTDPTGKQRTWESAERATRPTTSKVDGVGIVALLHKPNGPEILLQKQFRPPLSAVTIEVPAGLVDPHESPEESAIRELREETGYHGTVEPASAGGGAGGGIMYNDPGFTNTNLKMVHVAIDMEMEENRAGNLKPELEDSEFIEVFSVPLGRLWEECRRLEGEGYAIDARVGTLAEGIELGKKWCRS